MASPPTQVRSAAFFGFFLRVVASTSMIANFVFGNFEATVFIASAIRKPTPITRSYFCWASVERFGM